ncbi:MAG: protein-L-isoaspartate(D-aspartate) O-methyltransferase, partial [Deltaproteobacteria bacterium]|nr:protein-L-isoaspartate(D-aspartate) O-methyltransferase [Deltaproteobacteria bacterium]
ELVSQVYTIEIVTPLAKKAEKLLQKLAYENITVKAGDGFDGWEEQAPFDAIILTCAVKKIPQPLIRQLQEGGRIILPRGGRFAVQNLIIGIKQGGRLKTKHIIPVRFVPMTGKAEK